MHSLRSAHLLPVPSHPLPYPQPCHIPPDFPAPTLLYSPFYYFSLASPPLPTYPRTLILPLHSLPSAPLASPPLSPTLPYHIHPDRSRGRSVSFPTSTLTLPYSTPPPPPSQHPPTLRYPSTSYLSIPLPSHPIHSAHFPALIPYPTVPSPLLPSPLFSHLPLSHLLANPTLPSPPLYPALPKDSEKVKGQDVLVQECIGAEIVWCKTSFGGLI